MPMQLQLNRLRIRSAIWQTVSLLMFFGLFLTTGFAEMPTMADRTVAEISFSVTPSDCPTSVASLGHMHCHGNTLDVAQRQALDVPPIPVSGSDVWHYAAVTCGPDPINQRLLRPPKPFRAPV